MSDHETIRPDHTVTGVPLSVSQASRRWLALLALAVAALGAGCITAWAASGDATRLARSEAAVVRLAAGLLMTGGFGLAVLATWRVHRLFDQIIASVDVSVVHEEAPTLSPSLSAAPVEPATVRDATYLRVVAIGGGTGLPQLLRGLRVYADHITAVVTVADDGGSSGRLRRQMGMLPPGDFRNNIAALSEAEELMTRLFQYRFGSTEAEGSGELAGHSFGNLFITAMAAVSGSFEAGIAESSRVLSVRGRVLPSTLEQVTLCAEVARSQPDGSEKWTVVEGESNIPAAGGRIVRVFLRPDMPRAYPAVIQAILQADLIVAGPGSFFTSVIPNLLVPGIRDAICAAAAPSIYVCNVATQPGETDGYTVSDHMRQLRLHAGDAFTAVLANRTYDETTPPYPGGRWVTLPNAGDPIDYRLFTGDLTDRTTPSHHDSARVAARLMEIYAALARERSAA